MHLQLTPRKERQGLLGETACERRADRHFRAKLKGHLPKLEGRLRAAPVKTCRAGKHTIGEAVYVPDSDIHHVFDSALVLAISNAIEDLALETGEGDLIGAFQDSSHFLPHKGRFNILAEKLHSVRVWAGGERPKGLVKKLDFVHVEDPKLGRYWMTLFDSPHARALLLARQVNKAEAFEDKHWVGFYTFNPYLIKSVRWRFNLMSVGLEGLVREWEKSFPLPKIGVAQLKKVMAGEK